MMDDAQENTRGLTVNDIMQREVLAADGDWPLDKLALFLTDNSISGAPVTDEKGELVGVVSLSDIVRHNSMTDKDTDTNTTHDVYLYELERHMSHEELRLFHTQYESPVQVREIMTPMIFKVSEEDSVQDVAEIMIKGRIHRVFVTREGKLKGIVTALDMLQVVRDR
jgi:CBS domain-containing protein